MYKLFLALLFTFSTAFSQSKNNINLDNLDDFQIKYSNNLNTQKSDLRNDFLGSSKSNFDFISKDTAKYQERKSPFVAAALSAVIPGLGQFYSKNYLKGGIWLGIEAGLWVLNIVFNKKGDNQTTTYENYANGNWDIKRYASWLKTQGFPGSSGINPVEQNFEVLRSEVNVCESQNFSHTLPPFGDQQYYEVIGKYQNFITGWTTAIGQDINKNNYGSYHLQEVSDYMTMRNDANNFYTNGTLVLDIVILNHLLSAADAVWTVSLFNKSLYFKTSINAKYIYSGTNGRYNLVPFVNMNLYF